MEFRKIALFELFIGKIPDDADQKIGQNRAGLAVVRLSYLVWCCFRGTGINLPALLFFFAHSFRLKLIACLDYYNTNQIKITVGVAGTISLANLQVQ